MPLPAVLPAIASVAAPIIGHALGGSTPTQTPSQPADLQGMRQGQIGLLNYLLGMGPDPRTAPGGASGHGATGASHPRGFSGWYPPPAAVGDGTGAGMGASASAFGLPPVTPQQTFGPVGSGIGGTTPLGAPMLADGGTVQDYRHGGPVHGPGTHTSDSIPAKLSNGEGVLTANTVHHLGGPAIIALLNHLGEARAAAAAHAGGGPPMAPGAPQMPGAPQTPGAPMTMPLGTQDILRAQHLAFGGVAGQPSIDMTNGAPQTISANPPPSGIGAQGSNIGQTPPSQAGSTAPGLQTPQQRLQSVYGPLGITPSGLQNQGTNAYSQMLNQPSPWDRAVNTSLPQLQQNLTGNASTQGSINGLMGLQTGAGADVTGRLGQLGAGNTSMQQILSQLGQGQTGAQQRLAQLGQGPQTGNGGLDQALSSIAGGNARGQLSGLGQVNFGGSVDPTARAALSGIAASNPGQGVLNALEPAFERNLAAADQVGGRFGTSNALGRQTATDQFNQVAQQALQQGVTQQSQAASSLGGLGNEANAQSLQAAIASAGNALQGGQTGVNQQLQALNLAQTGNLGQGQLALGANTNLGSQQLQGAGGADSSILGALQQLGSFNLQGAGQQAQNFGTAGQLGLGQTGASNSAANILNQLFNQQGQGNLNTVGQAFNAGVTNTGQGYQGQQNTMSLINQLLQTAQGASVGGPVISTPGLGTQTASGIAGLLPYLAQILGHGGGQSSALPPQTGSGNQGNGWG